MRRWPSSPSSWASSSILPSRWTLADRKMTQQSLKLSAPSPQPSPNEAPPSCSAHLPTQHCHSWSHKGGLPTARAQPPPAPPIFPPSVRCQAPPLHQDELSSLQSSHRAHYLLPDLSPGGLRSEPVETLRVSSGPLHPHKSSALTQELSS